MFKGCDSNFDPKQQPQIRITPFKANKQFVNKGLIDWKQILFRE